jgi:hypothetical protein
MVQYSKIEHRVETLIRERQSLNESNGEDNAPVGIPGQPALRASNLPNVDIDCANLARAELLQQDSRPDPPAATGFQYARSVQSPTQFQQEAPFIQPLNQTSHRIVYE